MVRWLVVVWTAAALLAQEKPLPAFPGAEGFGSATVGGRAGRVIFVTNLNDSGPGSFRQACEAKGPRMVLFRVAGVITLQKPIEVKEPFLTVSGQSAPGDGICLRGQGFKVNTHDVVVRFLRSRPGDIAKSEVDAMGAGGQAKNVIFDHCSATWSVDEALSPSGAVSDITVQWSLIGESLNKSVHGKGAHGYGSLVRAIGGVSLHHNLWVHNSARNPRLGDNYGKPPFPTFDVRNNVIYNYGGICSGMTGDDLSANYVANYIRPGVDSNRKRGVISLTEGAHVRYYVEGNIVEAEGMPMFDKPEKVTLQNAMFPAPPVRTTSAAEALDAVLNAVGAVVPVRDAVDSRIVQDVRRRTGKIINSQNDVGGWPEYKANVVPVDSDEDGIPDDWERSHGLDPKNGFDGSERKDGYTNLEHYLHELAARRPQ